MNDIRKFKYRLKELRKNYNMTQEELAKKLGIVRTAIANYETGRTNPDPETLSMIANIFNTSTDYLLGRTDVKESEGLQVVESSKEHYIDNDIVKDINGLSPESQEDLEAYIKLLKLRDMQKRNTEVADELTHTE